MCQPFQPAAARPRSPAANSAPWPQRYARNAPRNMPMQRAIELLRALLYSLVLMNNKVAVVGDINSHAIRSRTVYRCVPSRLDRDSRFYEQNPFPRLPHLDDDDDDALSTREQSRSAGCWARKKKKKKERRIPRYHAREPGSTGPPTFLHPAVVLSELIGLKSRA